MGRVVVLIFDVRTYVPCSRVRTELNTNEGIDVGMFGEGWNEDWGNMMVEWIESVVYSSRLDVGWYHWR